MKYKGTVIEDPDRIGNIFNSYFINTVPEEIIPQIPSGVSNAQQGSFANTFKFTQVTEEEILDIVSALNNTSSTSFDEIPVTL